MRERFAGRALAGAMVLLLSLSAPGTAALVGDCDDDERVEIGELILGVNLALGRLPLAACAALDVNLDEQVGIDELIMAVDTALGADSNPTLRMRGAIEGFYGPPYTFEQRRDLLVFLAAAGLNTYVYAPKLDPFHREQWRDPYPAEFLDHFRDLAATGRDVGVRFVFALSPGLSFAPGARDVERVQEKLASVAAVGVKDFCLFFDDIQVGSPGADPEVQTDLVIATLEFLRQGDPDATLCFISNFYAGTAAEFASDTSAFQPLFPTGSSAYFAAYERIPAEVPILWTGPAVFTDRLALDEAKRFREFAGRPVVVWDNYPVNDVLTSELFLGPYEGRDAGLGAVLDGVLLNTMLQPEASKIALWLAGRLFERGGHDRPEAALREALKAVSAGGGVDALAILAEQFQSHPLIGASRESARLAGRADEFFTARTPAVWEELQALFESFATNADDLESTLANRALLAELVDPARKLSLLGEAGLLSLDLIRAHEQGEAVDTLRMEQTIAAAAAISWQVGANTPLPPALANLLGEREATPADVFGDYFARVRAELG